MCHFPQRQLVIVNSNLNTSCSQTVLLQRTKNFSHENQIKLVLFTVYTVSIYTIACRNIYVTYTDVGYMSRKVLGFLGLSTDPKSIHINSKGCIKTLDALSICFSNTNTRISFLKAIVYSFIERDPS